MPAPRSLEKCLRLLADGHTPAEIANLITARQQASESCSHEASIDLRRARRAWRWIVKVMIPNILRRLNADALADQFEAIEDVEDADEAMIALRGAIYANMPQGPGPGQDLANLRRVVIRICLRRAAQRVINRSGVAGLVAVSLAADHDAVIGRRRFRVYATILMDLFIAAIWRSWTPPSNAVINVAITGTETQRVARVQALTDSMTLDVDALRNTVLSVIDDMIGEV